MTTAVILDIAIVAVLAFFMFMGWKRGLFRSLAELACIVVALVLAYQISGFAAGAIVDSFIRPAAYRTVEAQVDEAMEKGAAAADASREKIEEALENLPEALREKALEAIDKLGVSAQDLVGDNAREKLLEKGRQTADEALDTVVSAAVRSAVCAVAFLILLLALRLVVRALDLTTKLPVIHQLNGLGGLLLGAGKGLILVCLAVWVLRLTGVLSEEVLKASYLTELAAKVTGTGI